MKFLFPVLVIGLVLWFFFAVIAPARARKSQRKVADKSKEAEAELRDGNDSLLADWTANSLGWTRKAGDKAVEGGSALRDKLSSD